MARMHTCQTQSSAQLLTAAYFALDFVGHEADLVWVLSKHRQLQAIVALDGLEAVIHRLQASLVYPKSNATAAKVS